MSSALGFKARSVGQATATLITLGIDLIGELHQENDVELTQGGESPVEVDARSHEFLRLLHAIWSQAHDPATGEAIQHATSGRDLSVQFVSNLLGVLVVHGANPRR